MQEIIQQDPKLSIFIHYHQFNKEKKEMMENTRTIQLTPKINDADLKTKTQ